MALDDRDLAFTLFDVIVMVIVVTPVHFNQSLAISKDCDLRVGEE